MKGKHVLSGWALVCVLVLVSGGGASAARFGPPEGKPPAGLAQAPRPEGVLGTGFTYQGRLTDNGSPADGHYDLRFRLYDADINGNLLGTVWANDVLVSGGLFTILLDFGSDPFRGEARWLEIAVRPTGSPDPPVRLDPRQELTASAYALYALGASWSGLTGVPAGFADGVDNDTTYSAGTGLTLSGTTFSANTTYLQRRVSFSCTTGNAIRVINADGSVTCEPVSAGDWLLAGNAGTTPGTNFLGTTDNQALELKVNGLRALRMEPNDASPNLIGGYSENWIAAGAYGATIGGGGESALPNRVTDNHGTVGGGVDNQAGDNAGSTDDAALASVGGGEGNTAGGYAATVGGGYHNTATGDAATVPGGLGSNALGDYSLAAGRRAQANVEGCFVWGDSTDGDVSCNTPNGWVARTAGGAVFYTNAELTSGVEVAAGGSAWSSVSDRALKENVASVDTGQLLARLAQVPVTTWNYKSQDPSIRHIGPMAQDFYAAFGVGEDDRHISTIDADGVTLAAIQGLYAENQALQAENAAQQAQIDALKTRLAALEGTARGGTSSHPWQAGLLPGAGLLLAGLVWVARRGGGR